MKTRTNTITGNRDVMVEGMMTFGKLETGQHAMEFMCCEDVVAEPFKGNFHVQVMRDGNVYIEEKPKRVKNKPIFREDNSSLSLGKDNRFYFVFSLPKERVEDLPQELVSQASAIAAKVMRQLLMYS